MYGDVNLRQKEKDKMEINLILNQLNEARKQTEKQLDSINQAIRLLGFGTPGKPGRRPKEQVGQPSRVISIAGRQKIARAQKLRWAKIKRQNGQRAA
jgi:hypothetical protein